MLKAITLALFTNSISAISLDHKIKDDDDGPMNCDANIMRLDAAQDAQEYEKAVDNDKKWVDKTFSGNYALFWEKYNKSAAQMQKYKSETEGWKRPTDIEGSPKLWGEKGVRPEGVKQGALSDCWFLASASALAEHEERIQKIFKNANYSKKGIFQVTFYHMGIPKIVNVDDRLPMRYSLPFNAKQSVNGAWWLPILEKAYAKFNVNYASMFGGNPAQAFRELSGMPVEIFDSSKQSTDQFYDIVSTADAKEYAIVAACINPYANLVTGHAYTLLGVKDLTVKGQVVQRLLKIRNPWGMEMYTGPWNDNDYDNWTDDFRRQAGSFRKDDGIFFMPAEDFKKAFTLYSIVNYQEWQVSQTSIKGAGKQFRKKFVSEDDQEIALTVDYQNKKQIPFGCSMPDVFYNLYIIAGRKLVGSQPINRQIAHGTKKFQAKKGQKYSVIIMNWRDPKVESDLTLSAYAEKSKVTIE